jgi:hypothetical protein
MIARRFLRALLAASAVLPLAHGQQLEIRITEWMYTGLGAEFVEFTNVGTVPVDMNGWSYDDDSRIPGSFMLSGFGIVQPGESVIITETTEGIFRFDWGLPATVKVLGGVTNNLGRNDEINLYDATTTLHDRLTYGDQTFPGSIRTASMSGNPTCDGSLGANDCFAWVLAFVGDAYGSFLSSSTDLGNPGSYTPIPCGPPPPVSYCTAGTTSSGCEALISWTGTPSATATSGFTLTVNNLEGQKQGLLFYGVSGRAASAWGVGGTSYLCVKAPTQRTTTQSSGGTAGACDGTLALDWNAWRDANPTALGSPFSAGQIVDAQGWFRDPPAVKTTSLSNGLEFVLQP